MTDELPIDRAQSITVVQGFQAMRRFLDAYWQRGLSISDDIAILLGNIDTEHREDGLPLDIAQWHDWLDAVQAELKAPDYRVN